MELEDKLQGYRLLKLGTIPNAMDHGQVAGFWAVLAVVAEKGPARESVRASLDVFFTDVLFIYLFCIFCAAFFLCCDFFSSLFFALLFT